MFGLSSLFSSPIWQLIALSDAVSKYFILLGLFILSIICVAIIIFKAITFRTQKRDLTALLKRIKTTQSLSDFALIGREYKASMGGIFVTEALGRIKIFLEGKASSTTGATPKLNERDLEHLELLLVQDAEVLIAQEEEYLPFLGVSAVVSPLLGLFGTIWGLIHSFVSISQEKTADIVTIAPGIASALLTTLAGLVVAIPAMVAFHYFSNQLRKLESQLTDLSDVVLLTIKKNLLSS